MEDQQKHRDYKEALIDILEQTENSLIPSLQYLSGELEEQILMIIKEALPDLSERIDVALKKAAKK